MRTILSVSALLTFAVLILAVLGLSTPQQPVLQESIVIEAPQAVVWNTLLRFEEHDKWQSETATLYNHNFTHRQVRYNLDGATIIANQQVRVREGATTVDFIEVGKERYSMLHEIGGQIVLSGLADGSTEVRWQISYRLPGVTTRLFHRFKLERQFRGLLRSNLQAFKEHIESF